MRYRLREGVSFCTIGDQVILLDLPADRYFTLGRHANDMFNTIIDGREREIEPAELRSLVSRGILVDDGGGTAIVPCSLAAMAETSAIDTKADAVRWTVITRALFELCLARVELASMGLARLLEQTRTAGSTRLRTDEPGRTRDLIALVSAFRTLGVLVSPRDRCLVRSIALAKYCRRLGLKPDLILGVKLNPFTAHCWVQVGSLVLNDTLDRVRAFTPILVR